jgi:hypothetical protein
MNQTEFKSSRAGLSQCDRILKRLRAKKGKWVSAYQLHQLTNSLAVHSRISDLRHRGHQIENETEQVRGRQHSKYRLIH